MILLDQMPRSRKRAGARAAGAADPSVRSLLQGITKGKRLLRPDVGERLFAQGDRADEVFFIERGKVKISVLSAGGKEGVIAILGSGSFVGEGVLVGQPLRISTATVLEPSEILQIDKGAMGSAIREHTALSEKLISALLARNIDLEEDLCDQLFNHSEKRLARVLLKLVRLRDHGIVPDAHVAQLSHETLAEMVGTTRARVTHFMNKFRAMGLIDCNGDLTIRTELLIDVVLHD
jgi:CRP-like cAMP-binding protein